MPLAPYAIETSGLTKRYKIRETKPWEERKNRQELLVEDIVDMFGSR
jgi:hypothetical protein